MISLLVTRGLLNIVLIPLAYLAEVIVLHLLPTLQGLGTMTLQVRDTTTGCVAQKQFNYSTINCANAIISNEDITSYYSGSNCCSVIRSFRMPSDEYAQYISEIFINGSQVAEFTRSGHTINIVDMQPVCATGPGTRRISVLFYI
jgi:hypothetical protein